MAESIGGKIRNVMVGVLIGLLVIAFAVWGVNDVFTQRAGNSVLTVGEAKVSNQEFEDAFERELRSINTNNESSVTNQQAYAQGIHNRVLQRLLTSTVIGIDADELGVGVNRRVARDAVKQITTFQNDLTGEFSEDKLNSALARSFTGMSLSQARKAFEDDMFNQLRRQQTVPAIIGGLEAPSDFATQRYNFITEQRKAKILTITKDAVPAPAEPEEAELRAFVDTNAVKYTAPEYRRFVMLRLETFDLTPDLEATDEEIETAFQYRIELGELGSPETRTVVQITATDEETAKIAAERLARGDAPEEVASGLGLVAPQIFEDVQKETILDPETAEAGFALGEGEAKSILGSLGTYYAVGVPKVTPAIIPDLAESKDELRSTVLTEKAAEKLYEITGDIEDAMADGLSLEEISAKVNWPLSYYDFVDRSGKTRDDVRMSGFTIIPGLASDDILLREIFVSDLGFETDLFETSTQGYAAIRVEDIIDSKMRDFETVKDQATKAWKSEKIGEALDELAIDLAAKARSGESLVSLTSSAEKGITYDDVVIVRSSPPQDLSPQVVTELLDGQLGAIARGDGVTPQTRQIGKLEEIVPNQDGLAGQFLDILQEQATAAISSDLQNAYQQAILSENELQEYPANIKQALGIQTDE